MDYFPLIELLKG